MIDGLFSSSDYVAAKKMLDVTLLRLAVAGKNADEIATMQPSLSVDTNAISGRSDGNTVQLETEMLKLNQNVVENTLETQLVSGSLARLRLAITGKG